MMQEGENFGRWFNGLTDGRRADILKRPNLVQELFNRPEAREVIAAFPDNLSRFVSNDAALKAAMEPIIKSDGGYEPSADFAEWWRDLEPTVREQILGSEQLFLHLYSDPSARKSFNSRLHRLPSLLLATTDDELRRQLRYPFSDSTDDAFTKRQNYVEDMLSRISVREDDGKETDWQSKFGNEETYKDMRSYVINSLPKKTIEQYPGMKMGKGEFKDRKGDFVKYYYYQLPLSIFLGYLRGTMTAQKSLEAAEFSELFAHEYGCEVPMVALAVRSLESKKLDTDFGAVAVASGWTGNTFDVATLKKDPHDRNEHNLLEYLLGTESRGHGSVFLLPSLHFAGALNLKDANGQFLPYQKLRERAKGVEAISSGDEAAFWSELYSSGRAAYFYQDILTAFGIYNFIGHSRGGEAANLIACANHRRIKPINCLALMPASGMEEQQLFNPMESGAMQRLFTALDALVKAGNLPGLDRLKAVESLSDLMTSYLIRDAHIPGAVGRWERLLPFPLGEYAWLLKELSRSHKVVIEQSFYRAVAKVIGNLGIAFRGQWAMVGYDWFPVYNVLGELDSLSVPASVLPTLNHFYSSLRSRLEPWTLQGNEQEILSEIRRRTQLVIPDTGHYGFMVPAVRELIFEGVVNGKKIRDGWWDTLTLLAPTQKDRLAAELVLSGMNDRESFILPVIVTKDEQESVGDLNSQLDSMVKKGSHYNVLKLTVYEFEKLRRLLALELQTPDPLESVWMDNEEEIIDASEITTSLRGVVDTLRDYELQNLWESSNFGRVSNFRLGNLGEFALNFVRNLKTSRQSRDLLAMLYLETFQEAGQNIPDAHMVVSSLLVERFDQMKGQLHERIIASLEGTDEEGEENITKARDEWNKEYWFNLSESANYIWQAIEGTYRNFTTPQEFFEAISEFALERARQLTGMDTQDETEVAASFIATLFDPDRQEARISSALLLTHQALEQRFSEYVKNFDGKLLSAQLANFAALNLWRNALQLSSERPVSFPDDSAWQELLGGFLAQNSLKLNSDDDYIALMALLKKAYAQAVQTLSEKI